MSYSGIAVRALSIGVLANLVLAPALAQTKQQTDWCHSNSATHQQTVDGCSALIKSGKLKGRALATVLSYRAFAYRTLSEEDGAGEKASAALLNQAIADYKKATEADSGLVRAWEGYCWVYSGEADRILEICNRAIALDTKSAEPWVRRADLLRKKGQVDDAIRDYTKAIALNASWPWPYINRASAHKSQMDFGRAIADYGEAIRIRPGNLIALKNRCQVRLIVNQLPQALQDCDEATRRSTEDTTYIVMRGHVHLKSGSIDKAIADYDASIKNSDAYIPLLKELGDDSASAKLVLEVSARDEALFGRGIAKLKKGDKSGDADIAAALKLNAKVREAFDEYGIRP